MALAPGSSHDILALDEALSELAKIDDRKHKVIEMRYFGGLTNEEIAEALGVSVLPSFATRGLPKPGCGSIFKKRPKR